MKPHKKALRRKRSETPRLNPGEGVRIDRPECGENVAVADAKGRYRGTLVGQFIFSRQPNKPSRSRYMPHAGNKELARK